MVSSAGARGRAHLLRDVDQRLHRRAGLVEGCLLLGVELISTMRSMPPAPITTGTPTYRSLMPYCPVSKAAQGKTRFLSRR